MKSQKASSWLCLFLTIIHAGCGKYYLLHRDFNPPGASVFVDGKFHCKTPYEVEVDATPELEALGFLDVSFSFADGGEYVRTMSLDQGKPLNHFSKIVSWPLTGAGVVIATVRILAIASVDNEDNEYSDEDEDNDDGKVIAAGFIAIAIGAGLVGLGVLADNLLGGSRDEAAKHACTNLVPTLTARVITPRPKTRIRAPLPSDQIQKGLFLNRLTACLKLVMNNPPPCAIFIFSAKNGAGMRYKNIGYCSNILFNKLDNAGIK